VSISVRNASLQRATTPRFSFLDMTADWTQGPDSFERSAAHRRGVRQACMDLENSLDQPAGQDLRKWSADGAVRFHQLEEAFRRHVEQSEDEHGLLHEIVETAPRLINAVEKVRHEHQLLLIEIARLELLCAGPHGETQVDKIREESLRLLLDLAAHRQIGADLIYEAYSVDIEGGEG
jgi:hypothetical protein